MLERANIDQLDEIYKHFSKRKDWFPHIRKDYVQRNIKSGNVIYHNGIIIIYKVYKRKQRLGSARFKEGGVPTAKKSDVILHQILNTSEGSGSASKVLVEFFREMNSDVWLSVRADNERACSFYEKVGMKWVGVTSWKKGTMPGRIYFIKNLKALDTLLSCMI